MSELRGFLIRFSPMIYGPALLFSLGRGAVIPLLPLMAVNLGADLAMAGLVASAIVVGQLVGNLPAGWMVARLGERITMVVSGLVAVVGVAGILFAPSVLVLAAAVFIIGLCSAAFGLARHAFMTTRVPLGFRARALSLLGGSSRLGLFVGPFLGALLVWMTGRENSAAWCLAVCLVACVALVWFGPDPETELAAAESAENASGHAADAARAKPPHASHTASGPVGRGQVPAASVGVWRTMVQHRGVLARLGLAASALSALRSARQVALPLWGVSIGLDAQTISLVVGISGAIDFALFYASGQVMDRFGRLWAVLPSMLLMGAGFLALALTHESMQAAMWFAMFAAVIGVGNGLSSGILMTLGADLAPQHDPAAFLGSWRTLTDAGAAAAPLLFSALAAVATLGIAMGAMGVIGVLGALGFLRWVPRYITRPTNG